MKRFNSTEIGLVISLIALFVIVAIHSDHYTYEPQYAQGEWKIEVQTPPCDNVHNVQVIYPKESGAPITIECDAMPVGTK